MWLPSYAYLVLLVVAFITCVSAAIQPSSTQQSAAALDLLDLQHLLREAEEQLLGSDSSQLNVTRAVQSLLKVHAAVSRHQAASLLRLSSSHETQKRKTLQQEVNAADASTSLPSAPPVTDGAEAGDDDAQSLPARQKGTRERSKRKHRQQARRVVRGRSNAEKVWQDLGRASFVLAALSASGLIDEYLPAYETSFSNADAAQQLCQQLGPPASTTSRSHAGQSEQLDSPAAVATSPITSSNGIGGSDSTSGCKVVATEPKQLQELGWLAAAAAAGTVDAQLALADRFLMGRGGLNASCADGLHWLKKAADRVVLQAEASGNWDYCPSFIRLRERFIDLTSPQSYSEWDEEQMAQELQAAAAFGSSDTYAQRRLGYRRLLGRGIPQDYRAAYEDFIAAADNGNDGYALYNLGLMYFRGWYVARDPARALQYFKKALDRGVGAAANAIGVFAANGVTMPADFSVAAKWFAKGSNMSDCDSIYNLGTLYLHGRGVRKDAQAALSYYGMAFDLGHWKAPYALGSLYAGDEPGLGHNCEYAEKYFWQFVSQRSGWLTAAQAAITDYDSPSRPNTAAVVRAVSRSSAAQDPTHPQGQVTGRPPPPLTSEAEKLPSSTSHTSAVDDSRSTSASASSTAGGISSSMGERRLRVIPETSQQQVKDRYVQALLRYLLLAESGCEAAAENAAWMLLHGQGASGPRAMGLAAHLLYRSSMLNHTSSMVELARLLLNESIITHGDSLQLAAAMSEDPLAQPPPHSPLQQAAQLNQPQQHTSDSSSSQPSASSDTSTPSATLSLGLLHGVLLRDPQAFMPPVAGLTACTGLHRRDLPHVLWNVSNTTAVLPTGRIAHGPNGKSMASTLSATGRAGSWPVAADGVASTLVWRARRAAVAWLWEASSVGDAEAAALLGWLWHEGVLQGSRAQQEALAVIKQSLNMHQPAGQHAALQLVQLVIWLEQHVSHWVGWQPVSAIRAAVVFLQDAVVHLHGLHPVVLDMADGLHHTLPKSPPVVRAQAAQRWRSGVRVNAVLQTAFHAVQECVQFVVARNMAVMDGSRSGEVRVGHRGGGKPSGFWEAIGADKVDPENIILTCLLGALAAVLWLHVRQQGQAARRAMDAGPGVVRADAGTAGRGAHAAEQAPQQHEQGPNALQQRAEQQEASSGLPGSGTASAVTDQHGTEAEQSHVGMEEHSSTGLQQRQRPREQPNNGVLGDA